MVISIMEWQRCRQRCRLTKFQKSLLSYPRKKPFGKAYENLGKLFQRREQDHKPFLAILISFIIRPVKTAYWDGAQTYKMKYIIKKLRTNNVSAEKVENYKQHYHCYNDIHPEICHFQDSGKRPSTFWILIYLLFFCSQYLYQLSRETLRLLWDIFQNW